MADQQTQQVDDRSLASDNNMAVETGVTAQQQQNVTTDHDGLADQSATKKVRVEGTQQGLGDVVPLKDLSIDMTSDVTKLSSTQRKQQMEEILAHAKALGRTVDQLPIKERAHFSRLTLAQDEHNELAKKHFEELKNEGVMQPGDADIWIDMLKANDLDPYLQDSVATYAAASRGYAKKREDERDEALKRLRNAEDEIKTLKSQQSQQPAMAMGRPVTTFQQQAQQTAKQAQQQPALHSNEMKVKAVSTYYHKFGESELAPFGQRSETLDKNSFGALLSDAIMSRVNQNGR